MRATRLVLVASLYAVGLSAQEPSAPARRWSIAGAAGAIGGGPAASAVGALGAMGWSDTTPYSCGFIFCGGGTEHPWAARGGVGELTVRYDLSHRWALSVGTTWNLQLGDVHGYRDGPPTDPYGFSTGDFVHGYFEGRSSWVAWHGKAAERVSAGLGIGFHQVSDRIDELATGWSSHRRLGLMGEAGLRLPRASRVFWQFGFRGHWIPGTARFREPSYGGTVPLDVGLSYATITTGVGLRF